MSLFTRDDLIAAIPDSHILLATDDDGEDGTDEAVFASVLVDATAWINGYLEQAGLAIPDPVPSRLKHIGVKYAEYALHRRRGNAERAAQVYEEWIKPAMLWLGKIATGAETLLPIDDDVTPGGLVSEPSRTHFPQGGMMV